MPRNGSGTYSLPAGNPVVSGTTIQASWANSTLADISTELTGSLARSGAGGMLGSLRGVDGTVSVPAFSFTSETTSGFYRAGTGDVRFAMAGADVYTVTSTGVGIGTTNPQFKLDVQGASGVGIRIFETSTGNNNRLQITQSGIVSIYNNTYSTGDGAHAWQIGGGEMMRLTSAGNLGVGTSTPAVKFEVLGAANAEYARMGGGDAPLRSLRFSSFVVGGANNAGHLIDAPGASGADGTLAFATNSTERVRITSAGDLLVGTTGNANNYKTHILTTGAGAAIGIFQNNATTPYGINVYYGAASPNNSNANTSFLYCNDLTTLRIQLASNGGIINYQANNSNLSDRREKTDFAPAKSYLDTICAIPVQTFKYIDQTDDAPTLGVVAQDVQAVAPELVMESNWGTEDNPKMRLSIYETDLQYALMKCIQEQQALITDLRARVAALEAA